MIGILSKGGKAVEFGSRYKQEAGRNRLGSAL